MEYPIPDLMRKGFSLIELLVVITIISILAGFSLAGWGSFRNKQTLEAAGQELASQLEAVKSKAINGEKPRTIDPDDCYALEGYQVDNTLTVSPYCCNRSDICIFSSGYSITDNLKFDLTLLFSPVYTNFPVTFKSLSGATDVTAASITLTYRGISGDVTISSSGEVSWR